MSFAEMLQTLRKGAGLTQAGLADKAGVPLRTVQGWEQGYRCPVSPDFFKLTQALGVSADVFANSMGPETKGAPPRGGARKATPGPEKTKGPRGRPRKVR